MIPLIIYHGKCADGYTAAHIARRALRELGTEEPELVAGVYGEPLPPNTENRDVYVLDFSYPRAQMEALIASCRLLVWLDHHATAIKESGDLMERHAVKVIGQLNVNRSGAWLTWEWFHKGQVPKMVELVDDRDRWVFKFPESRAFAAGLFAREYTEENWDFAMAREQDVIQQGRIIDAAKMKDIYEHLDVMMYMGKLGTKGLLIPMCNLTYMSASDACAEMLKRCPEAKYAATWFLRKDGKYVYSLRSRTDDSFDVGSLAKMYGGGGHLSSSGFAVAERVDFPA